VKYKTKRSTRRVTEKKNFVTKPCFVEEDEDEKKRTRNSQKEREERIAVKNLVE
jgi:hypothetical protein